MLGTKVRSLDCSENVSMLFKLIYFLLLDDEMDTLPNEIIMTIHEYLNLNDIYNFRCLSKYFFKLKHDDHYYIVDLFYIKTYGRSKTEHTKCVLTGNPKNLPIAMNNSIYREQFHKMSRFVCQSKFALKSKMKGRKIIIKKDNDEHELVIKNVFNGKDIGKWIYKHTTRKRDIIIKKYDLDIKSYFEQHQPSHYEIIECFRHPAFSEKAFEMYLNKYLFDHNYLSKNYEKFLDIPLNIFHKKNLIEGCFTINKDLTIDQYYDTFTEQISWVVNFKQLIDVMNSKNLYISFV